MDRIEDESLRRTFIVMGCQLCNARPSEGHHIKSRGSWGPDLEKNLIALCRSHHTMIHQYGINKMIIGFPALELILRGKGWYPQKIGEGSNEITKWFNESVRC